MVDQTETCDDGNEDDSDGCSGCAQVPGWTCTDAPSTCATSCGDGIRAGTEECDDAALMVEGACDSSCNYNVLQETEPNENATQAMANGSIRPGWLYQGDVEVQGYMDFWYLHLDKISQLRLQLANTRDLSVPCYRDPQLHIYNNMGGLMATDLNSGPGECPELNALSTFVRQAPPGDYVLHVSSQRPYALFPYYMLLTVLSECGDGVKDTYEECDGTPGCQPTCRFTPICGNGRLEQGELCDDANTNPSDGCDGECQIVPTYRCAGTPSFCVGVEYVCNDGNDDDMDARTDGDDSDCEAAAVSDLCGAGQRQITLSSRHVPLALVDNGTMESRLLVPAGFGTVRRAVLKLNLRHQNSPQVDVTLRSPAGTEVELTSDNGLTNGEGYIGTVFNDGCIDPITSAASPFEGCYSPESPLGVLDGENSEGTWRLVVTDDTGTAWGVLQAWTLLMCTEP